MVTVEKVEKEYETFPIQSDYKKTGGDLYSYLEVCIDDVDQDMDELEYIIQRDIKMKIEAVMKGFLTLQNPNKEYYDADIEMAEEALVRAETFQSFFVTIQEMITADNQDELTRLMDFTKDYYMRDFDYIESLRDGLRFETLGFTCTAKYDDVFDAFCQFFQRRINELSPKKPVEKTKEI